MNIRKMFAQNFYAGDIECFVDEYVRDYEPRHDLSKIHAGLVPHAGWMFSGRVAAHVFASVKNICQPDSIIIFGTVHNTGFVTNSSIYKEGAWSTPIGNITVDADLASEIFDSLPGVLVDKPDFHDGEHSIEVQLPFIKYMFPGTRIVPIAVIPDAGAIEIGESVGKIVKKCSKNVIIIGTSDLTHYGSNYGFIPAGCGESALKWMHINDKSIIELSLNLDAEAIVPEAEKKRNACGPGAMAATASFARFIGLEKGRLLDYTTSYEVLPEGEFSLGVGYAGIVY